MKNLSGSNGEKGFTLIELAIVLVIIGLILGAVLKGKDLIESAKIKKIYTQYVQGWELAVDNYLDRTGQILGDGKANGGTANSPDGYFDNVNLGNTSTVQARLKAVGLDVPVTNTGNSGTYSIDGKYTRRTVTAYLYYLPSIVDGQNYNTLYIVNMPTDVAIALDTIIDGSANDASGLFRRYPDNSDANGVWPDADGTTKVVNVMYIIK